MVPEMVWHPGLDSQGQLDGCKGLGLDDKTSLDQGHQLVLAIDIFPSQVVADDDCQVTLVVAWDGNGAVAEAHHVTFLAVTLSHTAPFLLPHIQVGHGLYLALSCYGWDGETQVHAAYSGQDLAVRTGHCPPAVEFQSYLASGEYCVAPAHRIALWSSRPLAVRVVLLDGDHAALVVVETAVLHNHLLLVVWFGMPVPRAACQV